MPNYNESIVLRDAQAIVEVLPPEIKQDGGLLDTFESAILESLVKGQSALEVRTKTLELAYEILGKKVDKGFELVGQEFKKVHSDISEMRHQAEMDRVHAEYAKQAANEARNDARQALEKISEVRTLASVADAKSDSAQKMALHGNGGLATWFLCAIIGISGLILIFMGIQVSVQKSEKNLPPNTLICGVDTTCIPKNRPIPNQNQL